MSSRNKLILQMLMLDSGIIPFDAYPYGDIDVSGIDRRISSLEPSQRRIVKRKFRKLWRKACKHLDEVLEKSGRIPFHKKLCGLQSSQDPTPSQKRARRMAVILYLRSMSFGDNN